jgi:tetratricopeptide (TPR) repeat protein
MSSSPRRSRSHIPQSTSSRTSSRTAQSATQISSAASSGFVASIAASRLPPYVLLAAVAVLVYGQTLRFGYVLDDSLFITDNQAVLQGSFSQLWTQHSMSGVQGAVNQGRYRPLTLTMFAIEHKIAPHTPTLGHAVNILLYAATACVLYELLLFWFAALQRFLVPTNDLYQNTLYQNTPFTISAYHAAPALLATLLFVLHPTHTEVVANIKSRDILLGAFLSLSAITTVLRGTRNYLQLQQLSSNQSSKNTDNQSGKFPVFFVLHGMAAALLFAGAILSQEGSVVFVVLAPITVWLCLPVSWRTVVVAWIPSVVATALVLLLRASVVGSLGIVSANASADSSDTAIQWSQMIVNNPYAFGGWVEHLPTKVSILGRYIVQLFYPATLAFEYGFKQITPVGWLSWQFFISAALYGAALVGTAVGTVRRHPLAFWGWWFLVTMSIGSNLIVYYGMPMSDRMVYAASAAWSAMIVVIGLWLGALLHSTTLMPTPSHTSATDRVRTSNNAILTYWHDALQWRELRIALIITVLTSMVYAGATLQRLPDWQSNFTLITGDAHRVPQCLRAQVMAAQLLLDSAGRSADEAFKRQASTQAFEHLQTARVLHRSLDSLVEATLRDNAQMNQRGSLNKSGNARIAQAFPAIPALLASYFADFAHQPDSALYYWNVALSYEPHQHGYQARRRIVQARIALQSGQYEQALVHFDSAAAAASRLAEPFGSRERERIAGFAAMAAMQHQDFERAVGYFRTVVALNPNNQAAHTNIAIAQFNAAVRQADNYESRMMFDSAIVAYKRALLQNVRNDVVYAALGKVYVSQRRFADAQAMYEQALRLDPANTDVQQALRQIAAFRKQ